MLILDLPPSMQESTVDAARAAGLAAGRAFGFGGDTWSVLRPVGTGTAARTLTGQPNVTLLAYRQAPGPLSRIADGTPDLGDTWKGLLVAGSLMPGDVISSTTVSGYQFGVASIEPWYQYQRCHLERRR